MEKTELTQTAGDASGFFAGSSAVPVILVGFAPADTAARDRSVIGPSLTVGRDESTSLPIRDGKISKQHFRIRKNNDCIEIVDLGSTNGTFVDGVPLSKGQPVPLDDGVVIRAGRAVFVFHEDGRCFLEPSLPDCHGMAGAFHTDPLLRELGQAALSGRHVLLAGLSGAGKELSAGALASMMGGDAGKLELVAHNAARFTSEEEAASTLFGVGARVFSNVDPRPGLIEQAHGGVLFLDEIHNLPGRVQRSLLRVIEDGLSCRIGETTQRDADVRFVFASNAPAPTYELAHDLLARLRVVHVPPLDKRVADIPTIFNSVLETGLSKHGIALSEVLGRLSGDHYEALCLDGFESDNVRGLVDLADRLATSIAYGTQPKEAISRVFSERFAAGPVANRYKGGSPAPAEEKKSSVYENNKEIIVAAFEECGGNVSRTATLLKERGLRCSRRWLAVYADRWGLREKRGAKKR